MLLAPETVQGLEDEDIVPPMNLAEFKKEKIEILATNIRKSKGDMTHRTNQENADLGKNPRARANIWD